MSEIPNLKVGIPEIDIKQWAKDSKRLWYSIEQIKKVNAFWDKYKDNCTSFWKDYPEHFKNNLIQFPKWNEEGIIFDCEVNHLIFKDWLHDLLYKVE